MRKRKGVSAMLAMSFGFGVYSVQVSHPDRWTGGWNISKVIFKSELQFNYLFTYVHLSWNSYNFWMQPNIAMKFAEYVAWIICKHSQFGKKFTTIPEVSNFS